jgi:hypothetical protein
MDQIIEDIVAMEFREMSAKDIPTYRDGGKSVDGEPP